jgi:competence protein ComEC
MGLFHFDRRPLLLLGTGACCGVYIATGKSWLYAILIVVALTALGMALGTSLRLAVAFFVTVAFFALWSFASSSALDSSYREFDGRDCFITGRVVSVDAQKERYTLITVRPEGFFNKKVKVYLFDNRIDFIQGDGISLKGELLKPEAATNPGGYDSRKMLYGDGVTAIVFCGEGKADIEEGVSAGHLFGLLRRDIQIKCRDFLGNENGHLVSAMLIGDKTGLDPRVKDEFRDSGLSHTMAVSGSHVAYIILPLYFIFTKLGVRKKKYYPWLIVLLLFFAMLAGMQPSVLRAGITAVIMLIGGLLDRNPEPLNSLAASAIILLIINPFSLYDAGFILSFTSVLSILLFYKPITAFLGNNAVSQVVSMSLAVQLGILPVMAKLFYNVQLFSVFANILVFPVRALLAVIAWLMYLLSCVYVPIGSVLSFPVGILADMMASTAELFSSSAWSVLNLPNIHPFIIAVYYVVLWLMLYKKKNRLVYPSVGAIVLCIYFLFLAVPSNIWIFLDSGKADCFIIKTESGRDIMIDTGEYALGNSIAYYTGDYIDSIFLSHAHEDHIGGLSDVLERFRVGVVYIPGCMGAEMYDVLSICAEYSVPCITLKDGDVIEADGYMLEIFNPAEYEYLSLNDTSMVIKLTYRDKSLLLCGDCESAAELDMLARGCNVSADVLKVPHHGALNAAETAFFEAVRAKTAVITCGDDDVNHPASKTLERLAGCDIYRSDMHGAIIIELTRKGYRINTEKR